MRASQTAQRPIPDDHLSVGHKRRIFAKAVRSGDTVEQAAVKASVSRSTAFRWNKKLRGMGDIASKDELARHLTDALADSPVQYKAALAEKLAKVMGYEAPRQVELSDRTPRVSLRELLAIWAQEHIAERISASTHDGQSGAPLNALSPNGSSKVDIMGPYRTLASPTGSDTPPDGGRSPQADAIGGALSNSQTAPDSHNGPVGETALPLKVEGTRCCTANPSGSEQLQFLGWEIGGGIFIVGGGKREGDHRRQEDENRQ